MSFRQAINKIFSASGRKKENSGNMEGKTKISNNEDI